jgi:hypothetical protein
VVQCTTCSRNSDIVLLGNGCKVAQTPKDANLGELTALLGCLENTCNSFGGLPSLCLKRGLGLFGKSLSNQQDG